MPPFSPYVSLGFYSLFAKPLLATYQGSLSLSSLQTTTQYISVYLLTSLSLSELHAWYVFIRHTHTFSLLYRVLSLSLSHTHSLFLHTHTFSFTHTWSLSSHVLSLVHSIYTFIEKSNLTKFDQVYVEKNIYIWRDKHTPLDSSQDVVSYHISLV